MCVKGWGREGVGEAGCTVFEMTEALEELGLWLSMDWSDTSSLLDTSTFLDTRDFQMSPLRFMGPRGWANESL